MPELTDPNQELELFISRAGEAPTSPAFKLTDGGLAILNEDMTFDEYVDGLRVFKWMHGKLKMGFSQYITWGHLRFGKEKVNGELTQLEFDLPDVNVAMAIASVPPEMRAPDLTAEHYVVLARADIPKKSKIKWAKTASIQKLTPSQLKASISAVEVVSQSVAKSKQHGIMSVHGIHMEFDIWLRRVDGLEGVLKMEAATQKEILGEIKAIHDFYEELANAMATPVAAKKKPSRKPAKKKPAKKKAKKTANLQS